MPYRICSTCATHRSTVWTYQKLDVGTQQSHGRVHYTCGQLIRIGLMDDEGVACSLCTLAGGFPNWKVQLNQAYHDRLIDVGCYDKRVFRVPEEATCDRERPRSVH